MAEATGLQTKVTNRATSSGVSKRLSSELGRMLLKNSLSKVSNDWPPPSCFIFHPALYDRIGKAERVLGLDLADPAVIVGLHAPVLGAGDAGPPGTRRCARATVQTRR